MNQKTIIILAALGGIALYMLKKKVAGATVAGAAQALGGAVVDVADGAVSGVVKGTGSLFGIPDTDASACAAARAAGNTWDASFACSAGDFMSYLMGSDTTTPDNKKYETGGMTTVTDWTLTDTSPGSFNAGLKGWGLGV